MHPKQINIQDYNYQLPENRIAKFPASVRDQSKLLIVEEQTITEDQFSHLADHLPSDSLLVFNNTKVIRARLNFTKDSGAQIELFCLEPANFTDYSQAFTQYQEVRWNCLVGNLKKWKGQILKKQFSVAGKKYTLQAEYTKQLNQSHEIRFSWEGPFCFGEILNACGSLPIPPYLHRDTETSDYQNYQTIYSKIEGSVAAPTAGLHFTENVLNSLKAKNINTEEVTLHVGAGTFKPVKSESLEDHCMHLETIQVELSTLEKIAQQSSPIIAVGTTSVRTLESIYWMGVKTIKNPQIDQSELHVSQWEPYEEAISSGSISKQESLSSLINYLRSCKQTTLFSSTEILIAPSYQFKVVNGIITNFHQPQSTLLLLIAAFLKVDFRKVYDYALNNEFRFLSYGDSSLFL